MMSNQEIIDRIITEIQEDHRDVFTTLDHLLSEMHAEADLWEVSTAPPSGGAMAAIKRWVDMQMKTPAGKQLERFTRALAGTQLRRKTAGKWGPAGSVKTGELESWKAWGSVILTVLALTASVHGLDWLRNREMMKIAKLALKRSMQLADAKGVYADPETFKKTAEVLIRDRVVRARLKFILAKADANDKTARDKAADVLAEAIVRRMMMFPRPLASTSPQYPVLPTPELPQNYDVPSFAEPTTRLPATGADPRPAAQPESPYTIKSGPSDDGGSPFDLTKVTL